MVFNLLCHPENYTVINARKFIIGLEDQISMRFTANISTIEFVEPFTLKMNKIIQFADWIENRKGSWDMDLKRAVEG